MGQHGSDTGRARPALATFDGLRRALPEPVRRRARHVADPVLAPWGSLRSVRTAAPHVALTFDDGPDPIGTPAVLDALAAAGATATFFVLADRVAHHPDLARRAIAEGHEIGLHGRDHTRLTTLPAAEVRRSIEDGRRRVEDVVGQAVRFFRPPFGAQSPATLRAARRAGLEVVVWTADARDWDDDPADVVAARAVAACRPGAVLLLHDGCADGDGRPRRPDRDEVAARTLAGMAAVGLTSRPLGQVLAGGRPVRSVWFRP